MPRPLHANQGSWLNVVERLFTEVTEKCVRRGGYTTIRSLKQALLGYLDQLNKDPKPFVWTADADLILGKIARRSSLSGFCLGLLVS